jgi:hypothetical protein
VLCFHGLASFSLCSFRVLYQSNLAFGWQTLAKLSYLRTPEEVQGVVGWLRKSGWQFFAKLSDDALTRLCSSLTLIAYAAGRIIYQAGDDGRVCYVLISGKVALLPEGGNDGDSDRLVRPGEGFGELALLSKTNIRQDTAKTHADCELLCIDTVFRMPTATMAAFHLPSAPLVKDSQPRLFLHYYCHHGFATLTIHITLTSFCSHSLVIFAGHNKPVVNVHSKVSVHSSFRSHYNQKASIVLVLTAKLHSCPGSHSRAISSAESHVRADGLEAWINDGMRDC